MSTAPPSHELDDAPPSTTSSPLLSADGYMSTHAKMSLAEFALQLRDDQLVARIVHYRADLATSPELDAVTANVVKELRLLQRVAKQSSRPPPANDRAQIEIELIQSLKEMLTRLFREGKLANLVESALAEFSRRFARVFFESELHEKIRGDHGESRTMRSSGQALYHALVRNQDNLTAALASFDYASDDIREGAIDELARRMRDLRDELLGRATPELNALVTVFHEVMTRFFTREFPPAVGEFAWEVVREARLADVPGRAEFTIAAEGFPRFRQTFERKFLERLVSHVEDELLEKVRKSEAKFRAETLNLVADPKIFSELCGLLCDAIYEYLYTDGFLDLPRDWRASLAKTP